MKMTRSNPPGSNPEVTHPVGYFRRMAQTLKKQNFEKLEAIKKNRFSMYTNKRISKAADARKWVTTK